MGDIHDEIAKFAKAHNLPVEETASQKKKERHMSKRKDTHYKGNQRRGGDDLPKRVLPLYAGLGRVDTSPRPLDPTANTGLLFDKFCDHWSGVPRWKADEPPKNEKAVKHQFLDAIASHLEKNRGNITGLLSRYHGRQDRLVESLNGASCSFTSQWRFVSGIGMGHVLETGFVWHRILSVPYLPGSSVKGLIRAWADPKTDKQTGQHLGWGDPVKWEEEYKRLFGDEKDLGVGSLIVFDALPVDVPQLEVDIMNPHYAPYYQAKTVPPADYHSPVPIFFLTIKEGAQFKFSLAPRPGSGTVSDVACGFNLLRGALENLGAGAKTAVGYGYMKMK
ncbi:MAG: type III-B CRISPR module RAMP protein Cmr6 [Nitrospirota bacterium]|nr:type III-B CRISPR module RAMP protein Cmr6 [Nitrospirota bacterium]